MKEYRKKRYTENRERELECSKKHRQNNKERIQENFQKRYNTPEGKQKHLENGTSWRKNSIEKYKVGQKRWRELNPEKLAYYSSYHRALRKQAVPLWFSELDLFVNQEAHRLSKMRVKLTGFPWEVDHIIPIAGKTVCGLHVWNNFQVIPAAENRSKFNKYE